MAGPECDNDMKYHHARVSCHGDQIRHPRDRIGGLRSRHELGEDIDLVVHHQQRGAPRIDVRKLSHAFLLADGGFSYDLPLTCSLSISGLGLLQGVSQRLGPDFHRAGSGFPHPPALLVRSLKSVYINDTVWFYFDERDRRVMASSNEINPKLRSADAEQSGPQRPGDKIYRLTPNAPGAKEAVGSAEARPESKVRPDDRKPEPTPPDEAPFIPVASDSTQPKKSLRRPLMFALLPLALIVGGYFYVTGGAVMSTDNAYVQADMVGLSTDVSGIVREVSVHDNQKVAKGDVLFRLDDLPFRLALNRAEAQIGNTRNDLVALQASYRNMQAQVDQAQKDVDFNMVNFKRQEQLLTNNFTPKATYDAARNTLQGSH